MNAIRSLVYRLLIMGALWTSRSVALCRATGRTACTESLPPPSRRQCRAKSSCTVQLRALFTSAIFLSAQLR